MISVIYLFMNFYTLLSMYLARVVS